jgi:predicted O-linked N-acetylglucosamine transferase (SPINDLY family)
VRRFTLARFAAHGVETRRVLLLPPRRPLATFLAQYDAVDVALDPLPFNGGTTTLQALWQGVPVLSLPGASMQQRMGASILGAAGLQAPCLAEDAAHYVALAQALAAPRGPLLELRRGLRERLTPMLDARDFAARFGTALLRFASGIAHAHT